MTKTLQYLSIGGAVWSASIFVLGLWIKNIVQNEMHTTKEDLKIENKADMQLFADSLRNENQQSQVLTALIEYLEESREQDQERQLEFFEYIRKENRKIKNLIKAKEAKYDTVPFDDQHGKMWLLIRGDYFGQPMYKQIPMK